MNQPESSASTPIAASTSSEEVNSSGEVAVTSEGNPTDEASSTPATSAASTTTPPSHRLATSDERLSVAFHWRKDRYDHVIAWMEGTNNFSLFRSINGSASEDWPASPAIQQLSTETIEDRVTILGVGCSGTNHYSVSVQALDSEAGVPVIQFDWAVRLSKELENDEAVAACEAWLGTTYQAASGRKKPPATATCRFMAAEGVNLATTKANGPSLHRLSPPSITGVKTIQWSYQIA
ncbi:hypothetical protein SAMN06265222_102191 [Neorhodopirellula lusitana]|uniref:Uncharacterized protein n=1 Tax=Neorhodopirellula lusitana TaxID=445327 RepID=A0ABY1PVB6_9BACT|nr:hypothetical protein [Neorhodopirellula lusitana]SMP46889.1 hypothetical protein SAMN06265222_102191 [Neorhodopirellula lusitana]